MTLRSKILATVAGLAAVCAVLVATPGQNGQAQASAHANVINPSLIHYYP